MSPKPTFRDVWLLDEEFSGWLQKVDGNPEKAFCQACKKTMAAKVTSIKWHKSSKFHSLSITTNVNSDVNERPVTSESDKKNYKVTRVEIKLAAFFAEHNVALNMADHLIDLVKDIFPDSEIAQSITLKRSKSAYVMKALGNAAQQVVVESIKKNKFSMIIDETTDISTSKTCAVLVKYHDEVSKKIETRLLDLLNLYDPSNSDSEGSTGQHLFNLITKLLLDHQIPLENLIGFAADGASNIMGTRNSLTSRLRQEATGITIFKCACHSIHLCASRAAKTLPRKADVIRSIYTYFAHSAKRMSEFSEFQQFCNTKPHKILHVSQTRWSLLHEAVSRILEQWRPLSLYFSSKHLEERLPGSTSVHEALQDPSMLLYFQFLNFILPHFNTFNQLFQRKEPTIHLLYNKIRTLYRSILRYYLHNKLTEDQLAVIGPCNENNFFPWMFLKVSRTQKYPQMPL
ncbi:zinc finger BED domain-containing protein 5-like [Macrobrachium rosenbergii]|uniref:zinc finger BED domain-containing protein 5-like n=1 Tax=Macrobrachium rosenbergii TaxID=79674 RepID=UPI0034D64BC5